MALSNIIDLLTRILSPGNGNDSSGSFQEKEHLPKIGNILDDILSKTKPNPELDNPLPKIPRTGGLFKSPNIIDGDNDI